MKPVEAILSWVYLAVTPVTFICYISTTLLWEPLGYSQGVEPPLLFRVMELVPLPYALVSMALVYHLPWLFHFPGGRPWSRCFWRSGAP